MELRWPTLIAWEVEYPRNLVVVAAVPTLAAAAPAKVAQASSTMMVRVSSLARVFVRAWERVEEGICNGVPIQLEAVANASAAIVSVIMVLLLLPR